MHTIGQIEKRIYEMRKEHPLVIPQIDPDKFDLKRAKIWFDNVKNAKIQLIAMGGSMVDARHTQEILDLAMKYDFLIILYLTSDTGYLRGTLGKTAIYWTQVPHAQNTFYLWDGLITNSLHIEDHGIEPLPTVYVFDDRGFSGSAQWITRSYSIPEKKPDLSLAVAKAAEYLGVRFYIMAGGSGSSKAPPITHLKMLKEKTDLFVIPTSGIVTVNQAKELFSAGADAIHIGNGLENLEDFKLLEQMVKISKEHPGKSFFHEK